MPSAGRIACEISQVTKMSVGGPSCIVLGGGGFIGANLCRRLASSGLRVRAFGRRCLFPEALEGVEWYQGDFSDAVLLASAIETYDIVFHLVHATTPHSANLDMAGDVQQNVVSSLALMDISRNLGVKRIVFVSSGGTVYGPAHKFRRQKTLLPSRSPPTASASWQSKNTWLFTSVSMVSIIASCGSPIRSGLIKYRRKIRASSPHWFPTRCVTSASKYGETDRPCVTIFSSAT